MRLAADGITLAVGLVVLTIVGGRFFTPASTADSVADVRLDGVVEIDFSAGSQTLIMALRSDCRYCNESKPFYRRLVDRDAPDLQIVVAAPTGDTGIGDYLTSGAIEPDAVLFVELGVLPVSGTPTLLLVGSDGLVTHSWIGLLDAKREAELLRVLFG